MQIFAFSEQQQHIMMRVNWKTTDRFNVFVIILILMNLRVGYNNWWK